MAASYVSHSDLDEHCDRTHKYLTQWIERIDKRIWTVMFTTVCGLVGILANILVTVYFQGSRGEATVQYYRGNANIGMCELPDSSNTYDPTTASGDIPERRNNSNVERHVSNENGTLVRSGCELVAESRAIQSNPMRN